MQKYNGTVASALRRCRNELKKAGYTLGKQNGRYHVIGGYDKPATPGPNVHRVGCSNTIATHVVSGTKHGLTAAQIKADNELEREAIAALRAAGLPFNDRGWMDCRSE